MWSLADNSIVRAASTELAEFPILYTTLSLRASKAEDECDKSKTPWISHQREQTSVTRPIGLSRSVAF